MDQWMGLTPRERIEGTGVVPGPRGGLPRPNAALRCGGANFLGAPANPSAPLEAEEALERAKALSKMFAHEDATGSPWCSHEKVFTVPTEGPFKGLKTYRGLGPCPVCSQAPGHNPYTGRPR